MLKATVKNFMGCGDAEIVADKVAVLCGLNGQGKTSALLPIAAALRGGVPLGLQKTKAGMLIKTGAGAASIVLENETSKVSVSWPKCERRADGADAPEASDIAVGSLKFPFMPDKEKIELLRELVGCEPSQDECKKALLDAGISENVADIVWQNVTINGWDASLERAKEKGRSLKSQWGIIAGETYGEKKGANWFPTGWDNDLENAARETLEGEITAARAELEFKIANQAVSADELDRLAVEAEKIDDLKKALAEAEKDAEAKKKALADAEKEKAKLPELPKYDLICPHCGKPVAYQFGKLEAVKQTLSGEERDALDQKILDASNAVSKALRESGHANTQKALAEANLKKAEQAAAEYAQKKDLTVSAEEIDRAREAVHKAEERLSAFSKYHDAARIHNNIIENQKIIDVLAPEGIRRAALDAGLASFNADLDTICRAAGWRPVTVEGDMSVCYGDRPLVICSESEKFRAYVTLQILIAGLDHSTAVVIDAADILDSKSRAGLFKALSQQDFVSFVGLTVSKPDKIPSFKKLGIGRKYWIEAGQCEEVYNG
ncbi:MAG: hypothetical protein IJ545_07045 [Alphaproteobacteria bacterium]|nr:hypothetical protein [Alphaproteobacteria bacterium]